MNDTAKTWFRRLGFSFIGRIIHGEVADLELFPDYLGAEVSLGMICILFYFLDLKGLIIGIIAYSLVTLYWLSNSDKPSGNK
jgi:hypothetical protein